MKNSARPSRTLNGMAGSRPARSVLTLRVAHGEKDGAPEAALSVRPSHNLNGVLGSRPAGPLLTRAIAQRREEWVVPTSHPPPNSRHRPRRRPRPRPQTFP